MPKNRVYALIFHLMSINYLKNTCVFNLCFLYRSIVLWDLETVIKWIKGTVICQSSSDNACRFELVILCASVQSPRLRHDDVHLHERCWVPLIVTQQVLSPWQRHVDMSVPRGWVDWKQFPIFFPIAIRILVFVGGVFLTRCKPEHSFHIYIFSVTVVLNWAWTRWKVSVVRSRSQMFRMITSHAVCFTTTFEARSTCPRFGLRYFSLPHSIPRLSM